MKVFSYVNDYEKIKDLIEWACPTMPNNYRVQPKKQSLDGGLFAYNKSQQSSLPFPQVRHICYLGTLGMPENAWTVSSQIVVPILNSVCVFASKKTKAI